MIYPYRSLRRFLHPLRVSYVRMKARLLPILLPFQEKIGQPVQARTPAGVVRLVPRGSTVIMLLANGSYEPDVMAYLTENVEQGTAFLDIGANAGLFSLAVAHACPQAQVYAFEPTMQTFALLQRNIALNSATTIHAVRAALSDRDGQAVLNVKTSSQDGLNTLLAPSQLPPSHTFGQVIGTETVPTMMLDTFLEREKVGHVSLVKIDVEGAEAMVLQGAPKLLAQCPAPTILFECWADHDQTAVQILTQHGYTVRDLTTEMKVAIKPVTAGDL